MQRIFPGRLAATRGLRLVVVAIVAMLATTGVATGAATAKKPVLILRAKKTGKVIAPGTVLGIPLLLVEHTGSNEAGCDAGFYGELAVQGASKDKLVRASSQTYPCFGGWSSTGLAKTMELTTAGGVTVKASPKLAVHIPRCEAGCKVKITCVYEFSKLTGRLTRFPGEVEGEVTAVGKRNKRLSAASCAPTQPFYGFFEIQSNEPTHEEPAAWAETV